MRAFPPGFDQLPSWESRGFGGHAHHSGAGVGGVKEERRGEGTPFDIILGSESVGLAPPRLPPRV